MTKKVEYDKKQQDVIDRFINGDIEKRETKRPNNRDFHSGLSLRSRSPRQANRILAKEREKKLKDGDK